MSRAYGWTAQGHIIPDEADTIRRIATLATTGTSFARIVTTLNEEGILTATGRTWAIPPITRMLKNPRLIGKKDIDGVLVDHPDIAPILDQDTWAAVNAILADADRQKHTRKSRRKHLLSGIVQCSLCGDTAYPSGNSMRAACSHIQVDTAIAEREITERVLARVTSAPWLETVSRVLSRGPDHYREIVDMANDRIAVLATTFGRGDEDRRAFDAGVAAAQEVRAEAQSTLALIEVASEIPMLTDVEVVQWWADEATAVEDRQALLAAVVDHVDVKPLRESTGRDRFVFHWR